MKNNLLGLCRSGAAKAALRPPRCFCASGVACGGG